MARRRLQAAKCSQMSSPTTGTGQGGDRCSEACGAIIATTYKIGPWLSLSPEQTMYRLTEMLNNGSDTSAPEDASWIGRWVSAQTNGAITLSDKQWPGFWDVVDCINRGHMAVGGFDDYVSLRLSDGSNPYLWNDPHGLGHVLIIVGYDTDKQTVLVHDPLRADPDGQPADYSWKSFQAASFHDLTEVNGPALPVVEGIPMVSWPDDGNELTAPNGIKVSGAFRAFIKEQGWDDGNWPEAASYTTDVVEEGNPVLGSGQRQDFRWSSLGWLDNPPAPYTSMKQSVYLIWLGQDRLALKKSLVDAHTQLVQDQLQANDLKAQIATLTVQLQQAQSGGISPQDAALLALTKTFIQQAAALQAPVPAGSQTRPLT